MIETLAKWARPGNLCLGTLVVALALTSCGLPISAHHVAKHHQTAAGRTGFVSLHNINKPNKGVVEIVKANMDNVATPYQLPRNVQWHFSPRDHMVLWFQYANAPAHAQVTTTWLVNGKTLINDTFGLYKAGIATANLSPRMPSAGWPTGQYEVIFRQDKTTLAELYVVVD